jgi:hypothetical protein
MHSINAHPKWAFLLLRSRCFLGKGTSVFLCGEHYKLSPETAKLFDVLFYFFLVPAVF